MGPEGKVRSMGGGRDRGFGLRAAFDLLPPTPALDQPWRLLGEQQEMEAPRWRCWAGGWRNLASHTGPAIAPRCLPSDITILTHLTPKPKEATPSPALQAVVRTWRREG